ncbi:predicted protein [Verticillium alfalfae VaMs.102]|uniref:Predicted protein n=1 Tax=Verticillium alfalfae (strain VaMs.102 / ATCC MYA-4576 / FGSC 10136) TaxID=526221 RepID=C9SP44_VERA1|nr:predicted protein [Verticillium alfalfae VaMs.102]EEY20559.1 predicted protein [Verticillium alfalfae VaMs.102]
MVATRIFSVGAALALALPATASPTLARRSFEISEFTPFQKRQVSSEQFACHSACGNTIIESESGTAHCSSTAWRTRLDECLDCVQDFPIWQFYSEGVQAGATACGLTAEPGSPSSGGETETTPAAEPTAAPVTTTAAAAPTTAAAEEETTAAAAETTAAVPAPEPSSPASEGETTPESQYPVPTVSEAAPVVSESAVASVVPSTVATPSGNNTIPEPTTVEVDGAASLGFMGVAAMLGLAAIAL